MTGGFTLLDGMTYRILRDGRLPWLDPDYLVEFEVGYLGKSFVFEMVVWGDIPDRFELLNGCVRDGMLGRMSFAEFCSYVNTGERMVELRRMYESCKEMNRKMEYLYGVGYVSEWFGENTEGIEDLLDVVL